MGRKGQAILQGILFLGIVIFLNILGSYFFTTIDLTEEKRFTLTEPTKELLQNLDEIVDVRVLLAGEFPAGFKRLQRSVNELLEDFRSVSGYIEYSFDDPSLGSTEQINQLRENLAKDGIEPINLRLRSSGETTEKLIYPYAIFNYKGRSIPVNFLENEVPGRSPEAVLNNSISLLEYKFANAIQKLKTTRKSNIFFTEGHGELRALQTKDLEVSLRQFYNTDRVNLKDVVRLPPDTVDMLVVARPRAPFSEKEKFIIDQYVMNGGKVVWLIDKLNVHLDSLQGTGFYTPLEYTLNLDDMLFKYGVRIQSDLVLDLECSRIPQVIGREGNAPQMELFPWYYHPLVTPKTDHPIVKGLDRVNLFFPSSIDTIKTQDDIDKTVLLASSQYSRLQFIPVRLGFEILRYDLDPAKFNKPYQNMGVLLEGEFTSLYQNRVTEQMTAGLNALNIEFQPTSKPTKMLVVSDGDLIKNPVNPRSQAYGPLGFNRYEKYAFGNKDFIINAIEYLLNDQGVILARNKEVKLRLLDTVRAQDEALKWQLINILIPLIFLLVFGIGYRYWREKTYGGIKSQQV